MENFETRTEYSEALTRFIELKNTADSDDKGVDEYNELYDVIENYENLNNLHSGYV